MGKPPTFIVDRGEPPNIDREQEMAEKGAKYLSPGFLNRVKNHGQEPPLEKNPDFVQAV